MDLSWAHSTAQAPLLLSVQSSAGQDSAPRADGLRVPWRLQQPSPLRATGRSVFPTAPLFSSLPYLCCSFL